MPTFEERVDRVFDSYLYKEFKNDLQIFYNSGFMQPGAFDREFRSFRASPANGSLIHRFKFVVGNEPNYEAFFAWMREFAQHSYYNARRLYDLVFFNVVARAVRVGDMLDNLPIKELSAYLMPSEAVMSAAQFIYDYHAYRDSMLREMVYVYPIDMDVTDFLDVGKTFTEYHEQGYSYILMYGVHQNPEWIDPQPRRIFSRRPRLSEHGAYFGKLLAVSNDQSILSHFKSEFSELSNIYLIDQTM